MVEINFFKYHHDHDDSDGEGTEIDYSLISAQTKQPFEKLRRLKLLSCGRSIHTSNILTN